MESYNPATKIWTEVGALIHERDQLHTATMLNDGRILIAGGRMETDDKKIRSLSSVEIYDPSAVKEWFFIDGMSGTPLDVEPVY